MDFADPKSDIAFKKVFGDENKKEVLISFLNAVLELEGEKAIEEGSHLDALATAKKDGIRQGVEQGIEQGVSRGKGDFLISLLEQKFGPLPDWARAKIEKADSPTLEKWGIRILDGETIEKILT